VFLSVRAFAGVVIALGFWQLNTSLRWYEVVTIACIWFIGLLSTLHIPLWFLPGFGLRYYIDPAQWRIFSVSVGLPVALFMSGILLRNSYRSIRLKHILYLTLGGFIMELIRRSITGYLYAPSSVASPQQISITMIIVDGVTALAVSVWLIRILAAVGWELRDVKGKLLEPFASGWDKLRRSNPLVKQLMVNPQSRIARIAGSLLFIEVLWLSSLLPIVSDMFDVQLLGILTVAILVFSPTISTIIGMSEARGFIQADEMLDEVPIQTHSVETFIAIFRASLYNARWFLLACFIFLLSLTLGLIGRFASFPPSFRATISLIFILVTWAEMILIGTAAGVYTVLRGRSALHRSLVTVVILVTAFLLLTPEVRVIGSAWWVSTVGRLLVYTALFYVVLVEFIEFGTLSQSEPVV
jgi:hypothetical protein